jgi:hypothetical protein
MLTQVRDWARWLPGPPSWIECAAAVLLAGDALALVSGPGGFGGVAIDVFLVGGAFCLCAGMYFLRAVLAAARGTATSARRRAAVCRWAVTPCALVLALSPLALNWPRAVRFHLSRTALERYVATLRPGSAPAAGPGWVGLYRVSRVETGPGGGAVLVVQEDWFLGYWALVYEPMAAASGAGRDALGGAWYATYIEP